MIKSEMIALLASRNPHLFQREIESILNAVLGEITTALKERDRVELRGFGAFSVKVRAAHAGRNPKTGEPVHVAEKATPHFKAGKELRDRINAAYERRLQPTPLRDAAE